jgi:hypothetical protein
MISIIDMDSRIRRIAQESLSAVSSAIQTFQSTDDFVLSRASERTAMLILGLSHLLRRANPAVRSTSLKRFSSAFKDAFQATTDSTVQKLFASSRLLGRAPE